MYKVTEWIEDERRDWFTEFYYFGKTKGEKPHGLGILFKKQNQDYPMEDFES